MAKRAERTCQPEIFTPGVRQADLDALFGQALHRVRQD